MKYGAVTVTTTATLIIADNTARTEVVLTNTSDDTVVYIGQDSSVTVNNGTPFYENQTRGHTRGFCSYLGPIWGIVSSGSADIRYWETT